MTRRLALLVAFPVIAGLALGVALAATLAVVGSPVPAKAEEPWFTVTKFETGTFPGTFDQPFFVAVVGNDARPGLGGARGDALHVVGINPQLRSATILDIPRDTPVPIPGHGRDKATHAFAYGGLPLTVETLEAFVGVPISYAITTDFAGFVNMVDAFGGVDITIREPMHDTMSGTNFDPGPMTLDGGQALAFSRDRYSFGSGDFQRSENQGYFLISALATLRNRNPGAGETMRLLLDVVRNTETQGMGVGEMFRLASLATTLDPELIRNVVVPGDPGAVFADFADNAWLDSH